MQKSFLSQGSQSRAGHIDGCNGSAAECGHLTGRSGGRFDSSNGRDGSILPFLAGEGERWNPTFQVVAVVAVCFDGGLAAGGRCWDRNRKRFVETPNRKLKGVACQAFRGLANTSECPGESSLSKDACARQPRQLLLACSPDWPMVAWIGACATQRESGGSQDFQHRICRGRGDDSCDIRFAAGPSGWNWNAVGCKMLCQLK